MSCADGGQEGPVPLVNLPAHGREKGSALLSPPRPLHSSGKTSRGLVESAETCKKDPDGIFFGLKAAIETRIYMDAWTDSERISRTVAHILRFKPDVPLEPYDRKPFGLFS